MTLLFFFFFSSRRRHTRLQGDWSSDVCSSDLQYLSATRPATSHHLHIPKRAHEYWKTQAAAMPKPEHSRLTPTQSVQHFALRQLLPFSQIGRASCRERV